MASTSRDRHFEDITEETVEPLRSFNDNRFIFEELEQIADGLGPTYNAQGCVECHQNVVTGGAAQITEQRTGRETDGGFFESLGGSLLHSRATHPDIVERVHPDDMVRTFRISTNTLGDGFVECIANSTLLEIRDNQPRSDARHSCNGSGVGSQQQTHASAASAGRASTPAWYRSRPTPTSTKWALPPRCSPRRTAPAAGTSVAYDPVPDPEDDGVDVIAFANFMRSTKAPPRGPIIDDVQAGERLFNQIGCGICHTPSIVTARPGTRINGGDFDGAGGAWLTRSSIPYSDYLLHDVGTGDGIPVLPTPEYATTANQMRTAPLWGLRTRNRLMHDGLTFTRQEAILRHAGQATGVTNRYKDLSEADKVLLLTFLDSL